MDNINGPVVANCERLAAGLLPRRTFLGVCITALAAWPDRQACAANVVHSGPGARWFAAASKRRGAGASQKPDTRVELESSDSRLVEGFHWVKHQALAYVFTGDPVGLWYEASLPGRRAFCMRDVSHQSTGAQILGLAAFNENMLRRFAENISASRDWCSYWEINKDNLPAPVDYQNDHEFWYNLPANFDVLDACYRQFLWTGNKAYLDRVFMNFYNHTVTDYVKKWDINGDGLLDHLPQYGHRGIASYDEQHIGQMTVGADLVAAQFAAYRDFAKIQQSSGDRQQAEEFSAKAEHLRSIYNKDWWSAARDGYAAAIGTDGQFHADLKPGPGGGDVSFPLYCQLTDKGHKTEQALDELTRQFPPDDNSVGGVEGRSYVPEILYRYGRSEPGYRSLLSLMDPSLKRREYPEVCYAAVGTCATGLMGLGADSTARVVETFPQLTAATQWAALNHAPVFDNRISIRHEGDRKTILANESGPTFQWKASFPGRFEKLLSDGKEIPAETGSRLAGAAETHVLVAVGHGEARTVEIK